MTELNFKPSNPIRISQIVLGAIATVLSIAIIINPGIGVATLITLLSITLIVSGLERIITGVPPYFKKSTRIGNIVLGALAIIFGIAVIAFPIMTTLLLVTLLSMGLLFLGIARIIQGVVDKSISRASRIGLIIVGIISIAISLLVFAHPVSGIIMLTILLAINLLIIGVHNIVNGVSGKDEKLRTSSTSIDK